AVEAAVGVIAGRQGERRAVDGGGDLVGAAEPVIADGPLVAGARAGRDDGGGELADAEGGGVVDPPAGHVGLGPLHRPAEQVVGEGGGLALGGDLGGELCQRVVEISAPAEGRGEARSRGGAHV